MTPSSKAKVLTDAEMDLLRNDFAHSLAIIHPTTAVRLLATIDALTESESVLRTANDMARTELSALKAELALKDKIVEAGRDWANGPETFGPSRRQYFLERLNDLDKVMAR